MNQKTDEITLDSLLAEQPKPTRGYVRRLIIIAFICFILMAVGFWWFIIRSRPLVISPETTFVCEPLTSTQQVDYFAWLKSQEPKELATDENGFRVVLAQVGFFATGCSDEHDLKAKRLYYEELGLNPNEPPLVPVIDQYRAWIAWLQKKNPDKSINEIYSLPENLQFCSQKDSWFDEMTDDKREFLQSFLAENEEGINIFTRELGKDCFAVPLVCFDPEFSLTDNCMDGRMIQEFRTWQRLLAFRAEARIKFGDIDGAIDDIISMKRLARHLLGTTPAFYINFLIALSLESMAFDVAINSNPDKPLSREQWKRLLDDSGENDRPLDFKNFILGERILCLDTIQRASVLQESRPIYRLFFGTGTKLTDDTTGIAMVDHFMATPGYDWNIIAKTINKHFDHIIDFDFVQNEQEMQPLSWYKWLSITNRTGDYLRNKKNILSIGSLFEMFPMIRAAEARLPCLRNMSRISLALQLYRADHQGELPPPFTTDDAGKPLHSWRTLLLPYLGYQEIYDRIRLDEPWDSETNSRFHHHNIAEFRCPAANLFQEKRSGDCPYPVAGETNYALVVGNDSGRKLPIVVERVDPILWMFPDAGMSQEALVAGVSQIDTESGKLKSGQPGSFHPGGMNVVMPTGSVRFYVGVE